MYTEEARKVKMYEQQQHFVDLQSDAGFGDDSSWLAGDDDLRLSPHQSAAATNSGNENLDRRLLKDLVEIVPLFEHYMVIFSNSLGRFFELSELNTFGVRGDCRFGGISKLCRCFGRIWFLQFERFCSNFETF